MPSRPTSPAHPRTTTRDHRRVRRVVAWLMSLVLGVSLVPTGVGLADDVGSAAGRSGAGAVRIVAPEAEALVPVEYGQRLDVVFEANRRWRYEVTIRTGDDQWQVPVDEAATGTAVVGRNTAAVLVSDDLEAGAGDVRVRLFAPGSVERVVGEDVALDAVEVIDPDAPPSVLSTDFTEPEHTVGEPPVGWSEFRTPGNWSVENLPRRLEAVIGPGGRQGLMWDEVGYDGVIEGDVEVAGLVRGTTTGNALFQIALHASGNGTDYYYVDAWPSNGNLRINRFINNSFVTLRSASAGIPVEPDSWYQVVFRREGENLHAKLWPFGEDEPSGWQVSTTDATHDSGQVGVTHLNAGSVNDWAWFSVGIDGHDAQRAPDDVFEPGEDAEVAQVVVDVANTMVEIDGTAQVTATALYDDGNGYDVTTTATWTSSDPSVATVDESGVVTGVEVGTTTITASYGGVTGSVEMTVVEFLPPTTGFEDREGEGWTTHAEELAFLEAVDELSDRVAITEVGQTLGGRPLHLVRVGYPAAPDDEAIRDGHSILAVATQHGNEPAGREAALQHLRDLAFTTDTEVLEQLEDITMLYVPTANPDGREANRRSNDAGLDTNRDHHLLRTAEATAVAEVVQALDPEMVIDLHERPSGSNPDMELLWPRNLNVDETLREINIELVQDHLRPILEDAGYSTGLYGSPTGSGGGDERISRNVFGLRHKIGLLTETAGQDPAAYRVASQQLTLEASLEFFHDRFDEIVEETTEAPRRRQAHGADQGAFYLDGRDDVTPPPAEFTIDPGPCGYVLTEDDLETVERHFELFGIDTEPTDDDRILVPMDQPMMTMVPFLVDPRAHHYVVPGLVADDCDDLPDPPEPGVFTTDFTEPEHEVGEQPDGWRQFRTAGDWSIENLPRRLQATITGGGRQGLMWTEPGNHGVVEGDVEVAGLVRGTTTGNALFQIALHTSGNGTDYYYVDAWPSNGNLRINRFIDDSFSTLSSTSTSVPTIEQNTWYQVVLRREGDQLQAKLWPFGEDEPDGWQVTATDATHHRGQVGVTHLNEGTVNDWAWFSVATDGTNAERAPEDVFDPDPDAPLEAVEISPQEAVTNPGGTLEMTATAVYGDGNGYEITTTADWSSQDQSVATAADGGTVTGVADGRAFVTATYQDVAGQALVVVSSAHIDTPPGSHSYGIGQLAISDGGMVASADGHGAAAGAQMLAAGGNAVDAAVATAFTQTVVEPSMSHLGGRAQMLIRLPDGDYVSIDGGTEVPANYDPSKAPPSHASGRGYGTIALPGVVAALTQAHEQYGSLPLDEVLAPAIELATEGFELPARQADFLAEFAAVDDPQYEAAQSYFLREDGTPYEAGDILVQHDLARVLEAIAEEGGRVFYEGWIADAIVAGMEEFGGFLTAEALADYEAIDGVVLEGSYRGYDLYSQYDPSRGQVVIQALQMMEEFDTVQCAPDAGWVSLLHQAYRIGMDDRSLPPEEVTSKAHAVRRAGDMTDHCSDTPAALPASAATTPIPFAGASTTTGTGAGEPDPQLESPHTTHMSTADVDGMAVTLTQTIGPGNGSMVATEGLGFLYASTMGYAGSVPGTRPSTNLVPMIVERDGELAYVLGAAGGARIVTAVLATLARTFDEGVSFAEALAAPRFHPSGATTLRVEEDPAAGVYWPEDTLAGLSQLGYSLPTDLGTATGRVHALAYDPETGLFTGVADPRREGQAAGPPMSTMSR